MWSSRSSGPFKTCFQSPAADPSAIPLKLGVNESDTNDVGDIRLWMKIKLRNESRVAPAVGFRFGVELPNSDQARGIGTNTTNFYGMITAGNASAISSTYLGI